MATSEKGKCVLVLERILEEVAQGRAAILPSASSGTGAMSRISPGVPGTLQKSILNHYSVRCAPTLPLRPSKKSKLAKQKGES